MGRSVTRRTIAAAAKRPGGTAGLRGRGRRARAGGRAGDGGGRDGESDRGGSEAAGGHAGTSRACPVVPTRQAGGALVTADRAVSRELDELRRLYAKEQ